MGLALEGGAIIAFGIIDFIEDGTWYGIIAGLCRVFEGMGNAAITTAIYALVTSTYPGKEADIISFLQVFTGIGMMMGPLLGSLFYSIGGF